MHFAKDCDYLMNMVDNLLDTLTGGQHSKTLKLVRSGELLRDPDDDEVSASSDKQLPKDKDKTAPAGAGSRADKDKTTPKSSQPLETRTQSAGDKTSFEKQSDAKAGVVVASNGSANAAAPVMPNGIDVAKCNGNIAHG